MQAFRQLVQQILALSDDVVVLCKDRLTAALGVNGRVIVELVP
jgi:predicted ATPase